MSSDYIRELESRLDSALLADKTTPSTIELEGRIYDQEMRIHELRIENAAAFDLVRALRDALDNESHQGLLIGQASTLAKQIRTLAKTENPKEEGQNEPFSESQEGRAR